jgi:histidinol-phosphate phosphatase family protein
MTRMAQRPAIFLDRDGTIVRQVDNVTSHTQLVLLPRAAEAIRTLNRTGTPIFIVTNQPVVARGWVSEEKLEAMHADLLDRLRRRGAHVEAVYYCPHHPNADKKEYRKVCACRKPGTGMFVKAARQFKIDLKRSVMVGDMTMDIAAGNRANMKTVLLKSGHGGKDGRYEATPSVRATTLFRAVPVIKRLISV